MLNRRLVRYAIIIICIYLIVTTVISMVDLWRASDKLTRRKAALAALYVQRDELLRAQNIVNSPDYLEKVARDQLGLAKTGEEIVIIPDELLKLGVIEATPSTVPNWQKWARLLL